MNLLIVDDNREIRQFISKSLTKRGHKCKLAKNGVEAVSLYKQNYYDCVLLDIDMPVMDGITAAEEILSTDPDASIVMTTGFKDMDFIRSTMRLGVFDYVIKPVEPLEIARILNKVEERNSLLKLKRDYQHQLEIKVEAQRNKLEGMMFATVQSLVKAVEARDPYTSGHSIQVKNISVTISDEIGLSRDDKDLIANASLVHDVGKLGVPDPILLKPGALTEEEYSIIKMHPENGAEILRPSVSDNRIIDIVLHHHERYDGNGFPDGISKNEIHEFTRIVIIADALSAMLSVRPYRNKLEENTIRRELEQNSGTQFDPDLSKVAIKLFGEGKIGR